MDEAFRFKGFDLKTGKVEQEAYLKIKIKLKGEGPVYLWTRNALERSGYEIDSTANTCIEIIDGRWKIKENPFSSLRELLAYLR